MFVPYGLITKTHGLLGEICLTTFSRDFTNLQFIKNIYIKKSSGNNFYKYKINSYFISGKYAVLSLTNLNSIETAKGLKNETVYINPDELSKLDEDEYYLFELIGKSVYRLDGTLIGEVDNLLDRCQQSLLVVRDINGNEILIPLVNEIVREIDIKNKRIIIDPPDGLLEIN